MTIIPAMKISGVKTRFCFSVRFRFVCLLDDPDYV